MIQIGKRLIFITLLLLLLPILSGCGPDQAEALPPQTTPSPTKAESEAAVAPEDLLSLYQEIYEQTLADEPAAANVRDTLSIIQKITRELRAHGVTAVDGENQTDMVNPQRMRAFADALENGETAELTVLVVSAYGRFTEYHLRAEEGALSVIKTYYQYIEGTFEPKSHVSFPADSWQYTAEGYFLFTGKSSQAQSLVLTMSEDAEFEAWRVEPLSAQYREWNRRYLLPVGYGRNNMFLTDWKENSYGNLDIYDLFDKFYPEAFGQASPYTASTDAAIGTVWHVPETEFEKAASLHLAIDHAALRAKTKYLPEAGVYEYRPRGFYETEYPDLPYPEVVGGTENADGTLTLLVNAVYPAMETSRAFTHELTVRPDTQDGFQYVSNTVLHTDQDYDMGWHTDRLTEEEWKDVYGQTSLLTKQEQDRLEADALTAAGQIVPVFQNSAPAGESGIPCLTAGQCEEAVFLLGKAGFVAVSEHIPMENPGQIEAFYHDYLENRDTHVTVFQINDDKTLDALTFLYKKGKLQTCYVGTDFRDDGTPEIRETRFRDIARISLTPKGYFIYSYKETPQYASLCQYWRIHPLPEKCRELTEKYVKYISYVNHDLLVKNWDYSNAETILTSSLYEDLCRIHTGQEPVSENGRIPASQYEQIMTRYLPVSKEQVRAHCGYDGKTDSYPHEIVMHRQYPPFGEVTDYTENPDGTITLTVDGVWVEEDTDCAFTSIIVIQPFADSTFRYLSNTIA